MDWETFEAEMLRLAQKIDVPPDIVVGIARGGVIPAVILSKALGVKRMFTLTLEEKGSTLVSAFTMPKDIAGKRVLLVEDMIETGRGMIGATAFLESAGAEVRTACLYTMQKSEARPDFSLRQVDEVADFPWNHLPGRST